MGALGLLGMPLRSSAEHHESWTQIRSAHFTVLSNAGEREGRRIALQFEQVRSVFEQLYPKLKVDSGKPTIVFALRNEDSLKLLMPSYGQNSKAMHIAGYYLPSYDKNFAIIRTDVTGSGPLNFHSLYHEYTHAFFRYNYRGLPLWLDEGLAELYGSTSIEGKQARIGLPNSAELRILQTSEFLPLDKLVAVDRTSPLYNTNEHAGIFYAESWALVHFLAFSKELQQQDLINKFLAALDKTDDPIEAAKQTFGDLKQFSVKLAAYIRQNSYMYQPLQLSSKLSENDFTAQPLSPASAALALADYLLHSNHLPEGLERLHEVANLDANTPGYRAQLGYYHMHMADYSNAEKELQAAIAIDPKDPAAHVYIASLYYRRDGYTKDSTPKIRSELETVIGLEPEFAPAYAFLSIAYTMEPNKDPVRALNCAMRATNLEPGNLSYFVDVGRALLAARRIPEAKQVAAVASKLAATPAERNMTTEFNKQIEYRINHSQESADAGAGDAGTSGPPATAVESQAKVQHAEGLITEVLCGHPPEVMLTLTVGGNTILLHAADIGKLSIQDRAAGSDAGKSPCAKWKDRQAKVDYRAAASGMASGELQNISLD